MNTVNFHHILTSISNLSRQFICTPPGCWCKVPNRLFSAHLVLSNLCDLYHLIFFIMFLSILYLTDTVRLPFITLVNLIHLSVIWYFSNFLFFCSIIICIVKRMCINFIVCSLHTCEIKYLIMITMCTQACTSGVTRSLSQGEANFAEGGPLVTVWKCNN